VPFYENRKKIIVKVAIKHFFCPWIKVNF
jgi:hypothetical protein